MSILNIVHQILSSNPKEVFKNLKSRKLKDSGKIKLLHVGDKIYTDENVADGFFSSISDLKTQTKGTA
jgi:hypothetical protein